MEFDCPEIEPVCQQPTAVSWSLRWKRTIDAILIVYHLQWIGSFAVALRSHWMAQRLLNFI